MMSNNLEVSEESSASEEFDSIKLESLKIDEDFLKLPEDLCKNKLVFEEFFSVNTWNNLSNAVKEHLVGNFLPEGLNSQQIQQGTIRDLFTGGLQRFKVSPMQKFQNGLEKGTFRVSMLKQKQKQLKKRRHQHKFLEHDRILKLAKTIRKSKHNIFASSNFQMQKKGSADLENLLCSEKSLNEVFQRSRKRYYGELSTIFREVGEGCDLSSDEEAEIRKLTSLKKRQKRFLQSNVPNQPPQTNLKLISTHTDKKKKETDITKLIWNKETYLELVNESKEESILDGDIDLKLDGSSSSINNIFERVIASAFKDNRRIEIPKQENIKKVGRPVGRPRTVKPDEQKITLPIEEDLIDYTKTEVLPSFNSPTIVNKKIENIIEQKDPQFVKGKRRSSNKNVGSSLQKVSKTNQSGIIRDLPVFPEADTEHVETKLSLLKPSCLTDLDSIDIMHMPMDFNDVEHMNILEDITGFGNNKIPELVQDTHTCFLSLIRDILCSTSEHRMTMIELRRKINLWVCNPITPLNEWFSQIENWLELLPSAIHFLTGEFDDQPEDFVPYIEFKNNLNIYQWIGAGRDTDNHLLPLCKYWLSRRNEMGTFSLTKVDDSNETHHLIDEMSDRSSSPERSLSPPPPPRCPTKWLVRRATPEEVENFRAQERRRYENPHMAFTYHQYGYESVVGPVKGIYTQVPGISRARGHNMLVMDRPNFVTILTLVRDATARLPNGEGTRADICELLKSSQYISPTATDQVLQTIVSGALDRMHTEYDPCVKYDAKRKIWIYLHRDRTEEEFEKLHLQQQGTTKHKKPLHRKNKLKTSKHLKQATEFIATKVNKKRPFKTPQTSPQGRETLGLDTSIGVDGKLNENKLELKNDLSLHNIVSTPIHKTPEATFRRVISPALAHTPSAAMGKISIVRSNNMEPTKKLVPVSAKRVIDMVNSSQQQSINNKTNNLQTKPTIFSSGGQMVAEQQNNGLRESLTAQPKRVIQVSPQLITTSTIPIPSLNKASSPGTTLVNSGNIQTFVQINKGGPNNTTGMLKLVPASEGKANIVSNITLQKGQTLLSPSQQKQIVQTLITQQQQQNAQKIIKSPQNVQSFIKTYTLPSGASSSTTNTTSIQKNNQPVSVATSTQNVPKIIQVFKGTGGRLHPINSIPSSFVQSTKVPAEEKPLPNSSIQQSLLMNKQQSNVATTNVQIPKITKNIQQVVKQHPQQQGIKRNIILNMKSVATTTPVTTQPAITRIVKPGISFVQKINHPAQQKSSDNPNAFVAKVLSASGNKSQIVSIANLTQKQGTTSVAMTRPTYSTIDQNSSQFVQISSASGNVQLPQYTVVSQNQPILATTPQQKSSNSNSSTPKPQIVRTTPTNIVKTQSIQVAPTSTNVSTANTATSKITTGQQLQSINAQQFLNAKIVNVQTLAGHNLKNLKTTTGIKMLNASNLNLTRIAGKPIIITNKPGQPQRLGPTMMVQNNSSTINNANRSVDGTSVVTKLGQGSIIKPNLGTHRVLVSTPGQSGQFVTQQIILPAGFQGNTLNLKGLKVIPLSQATDSTGSAPVLAKFVTTQHKQIISKNDRINEKDN